MKKPLLLFQIFSVFILNGFAQTISNVQVSNETFCPGSNISITFTTEGNFGSGNTFIAQLSNELGDFSSFTNVGSTATPNKIEAVIPDKAKSSRYKIRVISSQPYSVSSPNLFDLTLKSNPVPTFTYQVGGKEVQHNNIVLTGGEVLFRNTTTGPGECEWDFGTGASISKFNGCSPPPITYGTEGFKYPSLKIVDGGCSAVSLFNSQRLNVVSCNPQIPASVHVVRSGEEKDGPHNVILVCPGALYQTNNSGWREVYVESGGTFLLNYIGGSTAFATRGSVVSLKLNYGHVIYEESASVTGNPEVKLLCPSVDFDYSLVNCKCSAECDDNTDDEVITGVGKNFGLEKLTLFPNPSQGNIFVNGVDEKFSLAIYNAQGKIISEENYYTNSINLSDLNVGFYTAKITDSNGVRTGKLIISK